MIAAVVFWTSVALLIYLYAGYPLLVWAWGRRRAPAGPVAEGEPSVSVLVAAHEESQRIAERIANLQSVRYPPERLEILVGCDGAGGGPPEAARLGADARTRVVAFAERRGKPAVLNDLARLARGEILVLTDVRQRFEPGAIASLVRPFGEPRVGAVSGELMLADDPDGRVVGRGVGVYWRYEKFIRASESRADSTVGATGAIYAVRRRLFEPIPPETILDDVLVPLRVAARGYRVLFEPAARAWDRAPATAAEEFTRKVRTIAGNFQLFARHRWLLSPRRNRLWLQTVSHKFLRLLGPLLLVGAFLAALALADRPVYASALLLQLAFYLTAAGGYLRRAAPRRSRLLAVPYVFCLLNWATVVGFARWLTGRQRVTWERATPVTVSARRAA